MRELSVLIPARQEEWLSRTVADVCANKRGDTEVIVVLDGAWPNPGFELDQHPDVQVVKLPQPIGQRAATNLAARMSESTYVMKLDAHCALSEGFDLALIAAAKELGRLVTQIPAQKHLHVYDQICDTCGRRTDQSPVLKQCRACQGTSWHRDVVWQPRPSPTTSAWRFDSDLHFQYWSGARAQQRGVKYPEVLSCLGACWFLDRERYWHLGGMDEDHGSWGQMGTELACKSWLSGGRMIVNKQAWFAHFFRVGGHAFPYEMHGSDQQYAQDYSRNLWRGNHWPGQVLPLRWLVDKFWPVPGWTEEQRNGLPDKLSDSRCTGSAEVHESATDRTVTHDSERRAQPQLSGTVSRSGEATPGIDHGVGKVEAGIVYYSDCRGDADLLETCRQQLTKAAGDLPIVSVTLQPVALGQNIVLQAERGYLTMFKQILAGLEALDTECAFLAEHDVIYAPEHFTFRPPRDDVYYYNLSWWKVDVETGRAVTYRAKQTSQLCANRELLVKHYRERVRRVEAEGFTRAMGFEPGSHNRKERVDGFPSDTWRSSAPNYDIRHGHNLTPSRWSRDQFKSQRNCRDWRETTIDIREALSVQQAVA